MGGAAPHEAVGWLWLEWLPVGGENDDVLGKVAVEVILGETDCRDQCAQIRVKRGGGDGDVSRCVAISMPWRKTNAVQEAGCWPSSLSWTVVGFGATGEDGEVVGSVCPYLPLVAVSDSVVEGEVECQRGRDEGVDVGSAWKVGFKREEAGSVSVSRWEDKERMGLRPFGPLSIDTLLGSLASPSHSGPF